MLIDDIALTLHAGLAPRTVVRLLEQFGSAETLYGASEEALREAGLKAAVARSMARRETHAQAEAELVFVERNRLRALPSGSPDYPGRLLECEDYPHVLYVSGGIDLNTAHWLSVVGTRQITDYGARVCERLIGELAALVPDLVIVSGLAYGVDVAAHRAALKYGLPTVGVLGHPINRIYPAPHTETARRMVANRGAVLSEFSSPSEPRQMGFVRRNRVIAGLSDGTLVVESAAKGGSLITAEMADGYHRTLMAVPGRVGDTYSEGTNRLIRTLRAQMVCSGREIAEAMGWEPPAATSKATQGELFTDREVPSGSRQGTGGPRGAPLPGDDSETVPGASPGSPEAKVLACLGTDTPVELDELTGRVNLPADELALVLLDLELAGRICPLPGNRYLRT